MARIVSIDIGTSRIKVALFDETGNMNSLLSRRLDRAASPDTQDAVQWFDVTATLLRELNSACPEAADAVVLTGNMHALLGVDRDGSPVAPAQLWSDNSAQKESDQLNALFRDALLERFGNASIPVFTLPKIMRMKKETPERYAGTVKFLQSKDYIAYRLTGNFVTDPSDASGTLAMELDSKQWSVPLLDELKLDAGKLPDILKFISGIGMGEDKQSARKFPALHGLCSERRMAESESFAYPCRSLGVDRKFCDVSGNDTDFHRITSCFKKRRNISSACSSCSRSVSKFFTIALPADSMSG